MFLQILILIFLTLLLVDRWKPRKFVKLHRQIGNDFPYYPIVGNALKFLGSNEDRMTVLKQIATQAYKRVHKATSLWLGNMMFVMIVDADQAAVVFKTALEKKFVYDFSKDLVGNGTIFAPVKFWHRRRKILMPTFAPKHVNKFVPIFEKNSKVAADLLEASVGQGNIACLTHFTTNSLEYVCETLFGMNMNMQRKPDLPFVKAFTEWLENVAARMCQPWLHVDAIYKLLPACAKHNKNIQTIHEFIDNLTHRKKTMMIEKEKNHKNIDPATDESKTGFKTFLELMIENSRDTDTGYTDEELREESIVLAIAGTETSAVTTSFIFLLLSQHPDVQDKVYREIKEVLGDSDKPLQAEDLHKLKYTRAVIKETLRLYPPAPIILRHCTQDVKLPSGLVLPKGCNVVISIWGIQRNPEHWGEDANDFNPDRFMTGQTNPNAFVAFGYSSRNCVGQQFAMLSMTTTVVAMLRRYRFTPATNFKYDKNNPLRLSFELTMKHTDGFTVQVENRDDFKQNSLN